MPLEQLLAGVAAGVGGGLTAGIGAGPSLTWVDQDFLEAQGVQPWAGEGSLPLWLPRPEHDAMMSRDPGPAVAAGLRLRPVTDTAPDCLESPVVALTAEREAEVLTAWHGR